MFGDTLKQQVEDRLKFYESGEAPRKNIEVMKEALDLATSEAAVTASEQKDKKKKKKKKKHQELETTNGNGVGNGASDEPSPKKKKKKSHQIEA